MSSSTPDQAHHLDFDLYSWKAPRALDAGEAEALLKTWSDTGADPTTAPFEPSTDVGWFYRELVRDRPGLRTSSDAEPPTSGLPIWLQTTPARSARLVAIRLSPESRHEDRELIVGLAAKYDLVLFDARRPGFQAPLEDMAAYASATFWPGGAIQAFTAGSAGAIVAMIAWSLGIPVLSGLAALVGGFLFVMALYTFFHEGQRRLRHGSPGSKPGQGG